MHPIAHKKKDGSFVNEEAQKKSVSIKYMFWIFDVFILPLDA